MNVHEPAHTTKAPRHHPPLPLKLSAPSPMTSSPLSAGQGASWIDFRSPPSSPMPAVRPPNTTSPSWSHPTRERERERERERGDGRAWAGIRRALSLTNRKRPLLFSVAKDPKVEGDRDGDTTEEEGGGRAFEGPSAEVEIDGLGSLAWFPAPPGHAPLGPPLLLLPEDGGEEEVHSDDSLPPRTPPSCPDDSPLVPHTLLPLSPCVARHERALSLAGDLSSTSAPAKMAHWPADPAPPASHPFHHKKQPSVPLSTRTTSTFPYISSPISPSTQYASSSLASRSSNRHSSKYTAFSGSTGENEGGEDDSIYSYSTLASSRGAHWHVSDKPDISTVFEEDPSDKGGFHNDFAPPPSAFTHKSGSQSERGLRYPATKLHSQASSSTLVSKATHKSVPNNYFSVRDNASLSATSVNGRERSGTPSSSSHGTVVSTKSTSGSTAHPFANAVVRPSTPSSKPKPSFLSPQPARSGPTPLTGLSSSKSAPDLDSLSLPLSHTQRERQREMPPLQPVVVSTQDEDEDDMCPVCVEPMGATYRLPGEKPPIVPECGHALHEECFSHVYGTPPPEGSRKVLGVCGVCRQPMKLAEGGAKKDKLSALMGQPKSGGSVPGNRALPPPSIRTTSSSGHPHPSSHPAHSPATGSNAPKDLSADDPISRPPPSSSHPSSASNPNTNANEKNVKVLVPQLSIKSEFPCMPKNGRGKEGRKETVTCLVTVTVPSPRMGERGRYAAMVRPVVGLGLGMGVGEGSPQSPPSPTSTRDILPSPAQPPSASASASGTGGPADPFTRVFEDLKTRIIDPKTLNAPSLGQLKLFDILSVRKGSLKRDFHVYLCTDALVCAGEEKKSGFRQIFSSAGGSMRSDHSGHSGGTGGGKGMVLRLKGRIYLRHVTAVLDQSTPSELALNISMGDDHPDSFILTFRERGSFETWKTTIGRMMEEAKGKRERGGGGGAGKILGPGMPGSFTNMVSPQHSPYTPGSAAFSASSPSTSTVQDLPPPPSSSSSTQGSTSDLAYTTPLAPVHTPLDLVLVVSLSAFAPGQSIPLKVKLVRQSLAFTLALLGVNDRVSLVSCEMGLNGTLRKTPFLSPYLPHSRQRLEAFIETLGQGRPFGDEEGGGGGDEFEVPVGRDEKLDVVTAINTALDVVLQRKAKNPLSGMVVISETADGLRKAQMDLVTARLDAAHIPVHAIGYGRVHDPSPLWIVTSHTQGDYTFVKEWYHLRETLAGVVGGMMSVAMDNVKLHVSCVDNDFRVIKIVGPVGTVVVGAGKELDVELQELHYGQKREVMIELEVENAEGRYSGEGSSESWDPNASLRRAPSSNLGMGLLSVADNAYEDAVDEVPVCQVDLAYRDPSVSRSVARLAHPQLLTIAISPRDYPSDPAIVARRLELLAGDMITRAVLLASRKNFGQAERITAEMKKIIRKMQDNITYHFADGSSSSSGAGGSRRDPGRRGTKKEREAMLAVERLEGPAESLEILMDGILGVGEKGSLDRDVRDHSAQQSSIMRSQRAWTTRSLLEADYCVPEVQNIIQLCGEWQSRF
ncbi:hypothetical protein L198_01262 [Cryptococcus wingfieldii CBS 7118]|uniref:RING-type domain-containing protein n=1 Tax=Cryptococcus wingfieldii CBS 7118 TaxID=1295528 RepID=A0A1E3JYY0_9TREE|nr:hypothetical protein L198_01262 [Cryptococcus wingfieldii CBS 7118]ODO06033.1 hypothetical protein L198_01262 [Cryptococcus wingfieldii CBS 7118]